ncbi:hydroxyisourate hydrolase [Mesobacillus harenae]|uniref:hydroxyisourate hydrolase n=1 Tax=Mesobacillus harenae TaxID=2213203 RepID=UPI00157FE68A|nr:hydroxyisourate hydrolase [Mesobacillus harenae]
MSGRLTTHVLNLSQGKPAAGVTLELWMLDSEGQYELVEASCTNSDGRVDEPLLKEDTMKKGIYEIRFYVGDYYRKLGVSSEEPLFLDCVPIRFGLSEPNSHYHVPLLISPGGYSTYRGS